MNVPTTATTTPETVPAVGRASDLKRRIGSAPVAIKIAIAFIGVAAAVVLLGLLFVVFSDWRRKAAHAINMNSLKQIGLAMHGHNDVYKHLPTPRVTNSKGPVELSWRVSILGFIEQEPLRRSFDLDSAWDSPANQRLLNEIPSIYTQMQQRREGETATVFQIFTGPETAFSDNDMVMLGSGLTDKNFLCAEAAKAEPWTKPADISVQPGEPLPLPQGVFLVCMGDGTVRLVDRSRVSDEALRWYLKPNPRVAPPLE